MKKILNKKTLGTVKRIFVLLAALVIAAAAMDAVMFSPEQRSQGRLIEVRGHFKEKFDGFGTEWDPMLLASCNTANPNIPEEYWVTEEDFEMCCERAKEAGIDKFRCFWSETWIEPVNDNDDPWTVNYDAFVWDNDHIKTLFKQLDFAQENGITVNLTTWGGSPCPITDHFEYAEGMCVMLEKVIEMGYTCVVEMTPFNEPCWGYKVDGFVDMEDYWQLCRDLDTMLKKKGLRKKIKLNLSDCNYSDDSVNTMIELGDIAEIYNTHSYDYVPVQYDTTMKNMSALLTRYAKKQGAVHLVNEFGPNTVINSMVSSDTDTYERGLLISRFAVNFLNGGTSGVIYWCLSDQYYGNTSKMCVGLWRFKDEGWTARPQFYAYTLLTKYTQAGAKIYPIDLDEDHLCAIALKNPDKTWTYVVINSSDEERVFTFANSHFRFGKMDRFVYSEDTLPDDSHVIPSDMTVALENGIITDTVRAQSMNVYHSK